MQRYHLDPKLVPANLKGGYTGRKFVAIPSTKMTIPADAGLWSGGSRDTFYVVRLSDGKAIQPVDHNAAPWDKRESLTIELEKGIAVIEHTFFQGKDFGLRFYVHPDDIAPMLPKPVELTDHERIVLKATREYKSSYNGQDRYQMARPTYNKEALATYPSREQWEDAKSSLIDRKLLNKAGAITINGKNAIA